MKQIYYLLHFEGEISMMNKKVKAVIAMAVSCVSMISVCAAEPAFDNPQQEAAAYRAVQAQQAWDDMYAVKVNGENMSYHAVPAFDSPEEEAAAYQQTEQIRLRNEKYAVRAFSENGSYHAVNNNTGK